VEECSSKALGDGCRVDIAAGDYTYNDGYTMLPFSNTMATVEMTGKELIALMEDALDNALFGGSSGAYPYVAGMRFDVDMSKDKVGRRRLIPCPPCEREMLPRVIGGTRLSPWPP
jgi:2',3'-cyclic-nucleotide 2'-phosphodiesterase (5'-nucleotidase family)